MKPVKHRTLSTILLVFTAVFLATPKCAVGAPIYSQVLPEEPIGAFSSQEGENGQIVADNFVLDGPGPITVRSLRFIGGYGVRSPPPSTPPLDALPPDDFRVVFLEDAGGIPGAPIAGGDFAIGPAFLRTPTGGRLLNGVRNSIEFIVNLGKGISITPQTEYWITIVNNPGPDHFWQWARAAGVLDNQTVATTISIQAGPWNTFTNGGMWFELGDQIIPEPTSLIILLMGIAPAMLIRKR